MLVAADCRPPPPAPPAPPVLLLATLMSLSRGISRQHTPLPAVHIALAHCGTAALQHCKLLQSLWLRHNPINTILPIPGQSVYYYIWLWSPNYESAMVNVKIQCLCWSMWTFDSHLSPRVWSVILTDRHGVRTDCTGDGCCLASVGTQLLSGSRPDNTILPSHRHTVTPSHRHTRHNWPNHQTYWSQWQNMKRKRYFELNRTMWLLVGYR